MSIKLTFNEVMIEAVEAQEEISNLAGGVSNHLLTLAKNVNNLDTFLEQCKLAEEFIRSTAAKDHQVKEKEPLPRCWTQAKSNIKKAMEAGLNLKKFKTESEMRKKLNKIRKAGKAGKDIAIADPKELEEIMMDGGLQEAVQHYMELVHKLVDEKGVDAAVAAVNSSSNHIEKLLAILVPDTPIIDGEVDDEMEGEDVSIQEEIDALEEHIEDQKQAS